jgi:hypothetical protein
VLANRLDGPDFFLDIRKPHRLGFAVVSISAGVGFTPAFAFRFASARKEIFGFFMKYVHDDRPFARSRVLCSLCVSVLLPQLKARPAHSINLA